MAASPAFTERLRSGGLAVAHVELVSCEPLDPGKLPVGLRPSPMNVSIPPAGGESLTWELPIAHAPFLMFCNGRSAARLSHVMAQCFLQEMVQLVRQDTD